MCPAAPVSHDNRLLDPFAWLAALTAVLAVWIAYQQYRTNRSKLRLDLYERRFRVFDAVRNLLATVGRDGALELKDVQDFVVGTSETTFLFGADIVGYIEQLRLKAADLRRVHRTLADNALPVGPERNQAATEDAALITWFAEQFEESKKRFAKYLDFRRAF